MLRRALIDRVSVAEAIVESLDAFLREQGAAGALLVEKDAHDFIKGLSPSDAFLLGVVFQRWRAAK